MENGQKMVLQRYKFDVTFTQNKYFILKKRKPNTCMHIPNHKEIKSQKKKIIKIKKKVVQTDVTCACRIKCPKKSCDCNCCNPKKCCSCDCRKHMFNLIRFFYLLLWLTAGLGIPFACIYFTLGVLTSFWCGVCNTSNKVFFDLAKRCLYPFGWRIDWTKTNDDTPNGCNVKCF